MNGYGILRLMKRAKDIRITVYPLNKPIFRKVVVTGHLAPAIAAAAVTVTDTGRDMQTVARMVTGFVTGFNVVDVVTHKTSRAKQKSRQVDDTGGGLGGDHRR